MDLFSLPLELRALRSLTDDSLSEKKRVALLGRLSAKHFSTEISVKAFKRVSKTFTEQSILVNWDDLVEDPRLSSDIRAELIDSDAESTPIKKWKSMLNMLDRYRKRRAMIDMCKKGAEILKGDDDIDEDDMLNDFANHLNGIKSSSKKEHNIIRFGKGGNAVNFAKKVIDSPAEKLLKTGYAAYDNINGGFPTSGVVLLGSTTSGGKSVLSMNLGRRMCLANAGLNGNKITLEMTAEQEMNRTLSMLSGIELSKIKKRQLNKADKKALLRAAQKMQDDLEAVGSSYGYLSPDQGMTVEDVLWMATAYGTQLNIIDYVGLLEDAAGTDQWKSLSEIVRKCKIHSTSTGYLYVILVQLDSETGKIRYSRGMLEHADVAVFWNYSDPEVRATRMLPMSTAKARDGELFDWELEERFEIMNIADVGELEDPDGSESLKKNKGLGRSLDDSDPVIGEE